MPKARLFQLLRELQEELERTESVEAGSRELLANTLRDLQASLEGSDAGTAETLGETLRDATLQFEGKYPRLAALLGRVVDALSQIGI